jgi:hypothetical protein
MTDEKVPVSLKQITTHRVETKSDFAEVKAEIAALRADSNYRFEKMLKDSEARWLNYEASQKERDAKFEAYLKERDIKFEATLKERDVKFEAMLAESTSRLEKQINEIRIISAKTQEKVDKTYAIVEEQNSRNRYAMDGYTIVYEKLQETDARLGRIEKHLFGS